MSASRPGAEGIIADPDVILVGNGIMSATLGIMLKCLDPRLKIQLFEAHSEFARERPEELVIRSRVPRRSPQGEGGSPLSFT